MVGRRPGLDKHSRKTRAHIIAFANLRNIQIEGLFITNVWWTEVQDRDQMFDSKAHAFLFFLYNVQEKKACRVDTFTEDKDQHLEQTTIIFETQHEIATSNKENKIKYTE